MFHRFTKHARRVVVLAQEDARHLADEYLRPGHLMLGLYDDPDAAAGERGRARPGGARLGRHRPRRGARAGGRRLRRRCAGPHLRAGARRPSGHVPFDQDARQALIATVDEADRLGSRIMGTEHLLLGVPGPGSRLRTDRGWTLQRVRDLVAGRSPGAQGA